MKYTAFFELARKHTYKPTLLPCIGIVSVGTHAPRIVFTGGGQAHLYSLLLRRELVREGFDVTLVNSSLYLYYSAVARRLWFTRLARTAPPGAQTSRRHKVR